MKKKIGVYYDFQNVYDYSIDSEEYDNQIKFIECYCSDLGKIMIKNLYLKKGKYRNENKIVDIHQKEYFYKVVFGPYKKDIDTLMASDFMEDASKNIVDICVIISGDTDFAAPIEKVLNRKKQVHVICNNGAYRKYKGIAEYCSVFQILPEKCRNCEGEGVIIERCNKCNGTGELISECRYCNGTGWSIGAFCKNCEGTGWVAYICSKCDGIGTTSFSECNVCNGIGNIEEELCSTCFGLGRKVEECTNCRGTGVSSKEKCKICKGKGFIKISERKICDTCDGTGIYSVDECWPCGGTGKYKKFCFRCDGEGYIKFDPIE